MKKILTLALALSTFVEIYAQQNVGIGTNDPKSKLDVKGGLTVGAGYSGINTAPDDGAIIQGRVGIGTNAPDSNAVLDISSSTKGLYIPRLTSGEATTLQASLNSLNKGLLIYNTTTNRAEYWDGAAWKPVGEGAGGPPTGSAGGGLTGTYPNPVVANNAIGSSEVIDLSLTGNDIQNNSIDLTSKVNNVLPVANGGSGVNTISGIVLGNGGSPMAGISASGASQYLRRNAGNTAYEFGQINYADIASTPIVSGTDNYLAKFTAANAVGNSILYDNGSALGIGTTSPGANIEIATGGASLRIRNTTAASYGTMRIYNDQNSAFRALEIDYSGSSYPSALLTGGVTGEGASISTTGNYPMMIGTSNISRITILGGGNIGMGTPTPGSKLEIYEPATGNPQNSVLKLAAYADAAGEGPFIDFHERWVGAYPDWVAARIGAIFETTSAGNNNGALVFHTNTDNDAAQGTAGATEKMRIQGNGRVGIGTTAPSNALHIHNTTGLRISDPSNNYAGNIVFGTAANGWNSGIRTFDNGNAEMRLWHLSTAGQIIIANGYNGDQSTSMPTDGMFVVGDGSVNRVGIGYNAAAIRGNGGKLLVNGRVGINTPTPLYNLHVIGDTWEGSITADASSAGQYSSLGIAAGGTRKWSIYNHPGGGDALYFANAAGQDKFAVLQNGNVGVATPSPTYKFQVNGALNAGYILLGDNNNNINNTIEFVDGPGSTSYREGYINYYGTGNLGLCYGGGNVSIGATAYSYQLELSTNSAGKPTSSAWAVTSDARLKTNVHDYTDGLNALRKIRPVWFTYNGEAGMPKETGVGILAQELKEIAPYMIGTWTYTDKSGKKTEYLSVDNGAMTYMLINSVKEQQLLIEQQQKQINELLERTKQFESKAR